MHSRIPEAITPPSLLLTLLLCCGGLVMHPEATNAQTPANRDSSAYHSQQARNAFNNAKARRGRSSAELLFREDSAFLYHAERSGDTGLVLQSRVWHAQNLINYNRLPQAGRLISDTRPWLYQWPPERFGWAEYYETLGHWHYKSFKFPEALTNYHTASAFALAKKDAYRYHRIQESIATVWQLRGRSDSIQKVFDALEYYEKNNHPADAVGAAKVIALGYAVSGNPDKAIDYYGRAAGHAKTVQDRKMEGSIRANLADLYLAQKKYPRALESIRAAISLYRAVGFTDGQALAEIQQGRILTTMDQLAPALEAFNRGDSLNRLHPSKGVEMASTLYRAQWNLKQKNNAAADSLYVQSAQTASDYVDPTLLRNATLKAAEGISDLKTRPHARDSLVAATMRAMTKPTLQTGVELSNDEREALRSLNPYTGASTTKDSSLIRINHQEMQEAEARYSLSEKRDSLQALQAVAEEAQTKQRWTLALSASALLAALGLGLLAVRRYRQWKIADKERKQLALLKQEAHHQAKNHLAVVARLIDMAEKELEKPLAIKVLGARVRTLEALQQVLYQQDAANGLVPMGPYLQKLLPLLTEGYAAGKPIALQIDADVALPAPMASQLALLINELVTNSAKYAWPEHAKPSIRLYLRGVDGQWHLEVSDNGRGFPDPPGKGYGQRLVEGILHTLQGNGGYANTKDGVSFQCRWPMPPHHAHG